jgi:hypothetical protein
MVAAVASAFEEKSTFLAEVPMEGMEEMEEMSSSAWIRTPINSVTFFISLASSPKAGNPVEAKSNMDDPRLP